MKNLKFGIAIGFVFLIYLLWCVEIDLKFVLAAQQLGAASSNKGILIALGIVLIPLMSLQIWAPLYLYQNLKRTE